MINSGFSPWPSFTEKEGEAVRDILLSNKVNYWTGEQGREFEKEFAQWTGSNYAVALANGTVALDLALHVLGIGEGDEVIVTSRTFLASVSAVVNVGAVPVFADVSVNSQNITPKSIEKVLSPKTKAIICVHLAGWPCEMDKINQLASQNNIFVIEDCAQAHGAVYKEHSVGTWGDISCWSFCQDKIMTTGGEGGMITTNQKELWLKAWSYKDHGKSWPQVYEKKHPPGFRWLHESFGTNYRMTEMQSAIGRLQLKMMKDWSLKRKDFAEQIWDKSRNIKGLRVPEVPNYIKHAAYKAYVFVEPDLLNEGWTRDRIIEEIVSKGVPCFSGSCSEVYLEKAFDNTDFRPIKRLSNAKLLGEVSLMFLCHPTLKKSEIDMTCEVIEDVMSMAVAQEIK